MCLLLFGFCLFISAQFGGTSSPLAFVASVLSTTFIAIIWYTHSPMPVCENSATKLLWDFGLVTESHHPSNHPDIVLFNCRRSVIQCFEVSCPADINVISKETEKIQKYWPLVNDLHQLYKGMSVETVPVVIGHTDVVTSQCKHFLKKIPECHESLFHHLQKATLNGTIHTLNL